MIDKNKVGNAIIFQELDLENRVFWFDLKTKKFLHNIDTFYYSIKLLNDFTVNSDDEKVLKFRKDIEKLNMKLSHKAFSGDVLQFFVPLMNDYLNVSNLHFGKFYSFSLELPGMFDIFIAPVVPGNENELSVTSEIIVQIRSEMLWLYGVYAAYEKSFCWIKAILDIYGLEIFEVKENRTDYCWHSNYIQNPGSYFTKENIDAMRCTRLGKRTTYIYYDRGSSDSDFSYYCRGERGGKTFLRIYNKSMEVIQKNYKGFFFNTWFFHGLINRYDFYLYEEAYIKGSWDYVTIARLKFYEEYGSNIDFVKKCRELINQYEVTGSYTDDMISLADELTPNITVIINVEFQLMRKASKSYKILPIKDNSSRGSERRIYDFFDNHRLIIDYLTNDVYRLVEKNGDSNKSRRPNAPFWQALCKCKLVDVSSVPEDLKMKRIYKRQLDAEKLRKSIINKAVTYGFYVKGINEDSPVSDAMLSLMQLNDNDIKDAKRYKEKKSKQLNKDLLSDVMPDVKYEHKYIVLDENTGELIETA